MAINRHGDIIDSERVDLPAPDNPAAGWYEQQADTWWQCLVECLGGLRERLADRPVAAISVDATSSTLLLCDNHNQPHTVALMYNDQRAAASLAEYAGLIPADHITLSPTSSLAKAIYLLQQNACDECRYIVHQADWIAAKLADAAPVSDENNSLKLGYDSQNGCWPEWMQSLPYKLFRRLPRVVRPGTVIGRLSAANSRMLGLNGEVSLVAGTTDSTASTLATGIMHEGQAVTTIGTTLVMKIISQQQVSSARHGVYSHHLASGLWLAGGASNSGGKVLQQFFNPDQLNTLSQQIDTQQLLNLGYYPLAATGERFPLNDLSLEPRLQPRPDSDVDFLQAIFEGFAHIEKLAYERIGELGGPVPEVIITAGGAAADNQALTRIREKIIGLPVSRARHTEASYGSALLAAGRIY